MSTRYARIRSFLYSASLMIGCLLFTASLFLVSFNRADNEDQKLYFNIGKQRFLLTYNETGKATVETEEGWNYKHADTSYQLPPIPKDLQGYETPNYRFMVMYLNNKTYMTMYNGLWGRFFGDYNYTYYRDSHTWEFNPAMKKWVDAPANIQLPIPSRED